MHLAEFSAAVLLSDAIGPPALDAATRPGTLDPGTLSERLVTAPSAHPEHLRALALLWHDQLEAAHGISQQLDDALGSYLHGMMHRREGDYGNAKYWFRRAGALPSLASLAAALAGRPGQAFLVVAGQWQADAFVDCCASAGAGTPHAARERWRALQAEEILTLCGSLLMHHQ